MLQPSNSRAIQLRRFLGLGLISNLTVSIGLLPWLTLSAQGQAVLLETNPTPNAPSFEIPAEVTTSPSPATPATPDVAYEPEPYIEPAPSYAEPEPYFEPAPEPYATPEPAIVPEVNVAPEPYVEAAPSYASPAPIAQPEPSYLSPAPAKGCAALLISPDGACSPPPAEVEVAPTIPQPLAPAIVANENVASPAQASLPPARRVQARVAQPTPPPARQLTAAMPVSRQSYSTSFTAPPQTLPSPNYRTVAVPSAPTVSQAPATGTGIVTAIAPSLPPSTAQNFTAVKPDRYGLKPLNSRNPLDWILGEQAMLFPLPMPVAVSSAFGWRQHPIQQSWHLHSGVDFAAPHGTPVVAAYDGQVAIADRVGGYGLSVLLSHNQGDRQTRYAHLSEIFVRPGQKVSQGDVLGSVGSTGNSTGPHLHFETLVKTPDGMVVVDPTEEVKTALINTLNRMQAIAQAQSLATTPQSNIVNSESDIPQGNAVVNQPPIPVEIIQPMSRYQANANLSVPLLTE